MIHKLLSRDDFRNSVFERDEHKCVFCSDVAIDAHHIIERRLWTAQHQLGGYFLCNGISVCEPCHIKCETTEISVEDARRAAGITHFVIPEHLYDDQEYTKWGDIILANGQRLKGELFFDESVQKILEKGNMLGLYSKYTKYPRTYNLPWSESIQKDDRVLKSVDIFKNKRVIVSNKMDGENSNAYNDYFHARSIDGRNHPSRNWAKNFWSTFKSDIPDGWKICAENVYAKHAIHYQDLETYFYGFSVWNDKNICLSWDDTLDWFSLLGITSVPVLYDGIFDEKKIKALWNPANRDNMEGYVIRLADAFSYGDFRKSVGKFVRKSHVQPDSHHWFAQQVISNKLK
jgi:hypothetical protein